MIIKQTARELHQAFLDGTYTAEEITKAYLDQIDAMNDEINAYITVMREEALEQARALDKKKAAGEEVGPLAGVVMSIKDNIAVKGVKMTCASKMLEDFIVPYDAEVIKTLKAADAILIGKVNMDEFAMGFDTTRSYFGMTRNPLDLNLVSGGSSGGSAASVAGYMATASLGTDTGGSVRQPASFTGLIGLKPTYGSISKNGIAPMANSLDTVGIFTHNVEDNIMISEVLAHHDLNDGTTIQNLSLSLSAVENAKPINEVRIAIPKSFIDFDVNEDVKAAFEKQVEILKSLGATIEEVSFEALHHAIEMYLILCMAEVSSNMSRYDGIRFGHRSSEDDTLEELMSKSRGEGLGEEVKHRIMIGTHIMSANVEGNYYERAQKLRTLLIQEFDELFEEFDLLVFPTFPKPAYPVDEELTPTESYMGDMFTVPANLLGAPCVSVPMGDRDKSIMGMQILGQRENDGQVLRTAAELEREVNHGL